jgi:hypothetical protein
MGHHLIAVACRAAIYLGCQRTLREQPERVGLTLHPTAHSPRGGDPGLSRGHLFGERAATGASTTGTRATQKEWEDISHGNAVFFDRMGKRRIGDHGP